MTKIVNSDYTKKLYNEKKAWPEKNMWHDYTKRKIIDVVENIFNGYINPNADILNIGSGGSTYRIKGTTFHLDIAETLIKNLKNSVVGSAENIPFEDNRFDNIICVGSVINYCNAMSVISEAHRVLKNNGYMILEFERSTSGEFLFTSYYNLSTFPKWYIYNNQSHMLWMYSEKYIKTLLKAYNFNIIKLIRFHNISALANRFIDLNDKILAPLLRFDNAFNFLSKFISHNEIIICKKCE